MKCLVFPVFAVDFSAADLDLLHLPAFDFLEKLAEVDRLIRLALARFNDGPKQNRNADQHHPEDGGLDIRIHTTSLPKKQNTLLQ